MLIIITRFYLMLMQRYMIIVALYMKLSNSIFQFHINRNECVVIYTPYLTLYVHKSYQLLYDIQKPPVLRASVCMLTDMYYWAICKYWHVLFSTYRSKYISIIFFNLLTRIHRGCEQCSSTIQCLHFDTTCKLQFHTLLSDCDLSSI